MDYGHTGSISTDQKSLGKQLLTHCRRPDATLGVLEDSEGRSVRNSLSKVYTQWVEL